MEREARTILKWAYHVQEKELATTVDEVRERMERCVVLLQGESVDDQDDAVEALDRLARTPRAEVVPAFAGVLPRVIDHLVAFMWHEHRDVRDHADETLAAIAGSPHAEVAAAFLVCHVQRRNGTNAACEPPQTTARRKKLSSSWGR